MDGPTATATAPRTTARQCPLCEAHCGILVTSEGDRVTSIVGDPEDVMSAGYICPKATALADIHHDPERVRRPMIRVGDGFEECTWDEAFRAVGQGLQRIRREHGRDAVGLYFGNPVYHSHSAMYMEVLRRAMRTRNVYSAGSVDQFPQYLASQAMFGDHTVLPIADVDRTDHLLVIGANPAVSNGSITTMPNARARIKAIRARGGKVVVVDPRRTETVRIADDHLAVRPGGDPYLLIGMLSVLFADGLVEPAHLGDQFHGWDAIHDLVRDWTPERAAPLAGVDAETITRAAREFAAAPSAVAYARIGVCHHTTGSITHWLVNVLNAVTGNLDRPGGQMFSTPPVETGPVLRAIAGRSRRDRFRSRVRDLPELTGELPVATLADEMLTPGDGRIRAMVTYAGNPCLSAPDAERMDEAFASLDFYVAVDLYVTETTRHADVILPPVSQLERSEFDVVFTNLGVRNNARYSPAVFEPPEDGREDWEILLGVISELGVTLPTDGLDRTARSLLRRLSSGVSPARITAALITAGPQGVLRKGPGGLTLRKAQRTRGGVDLGPLEAGRLRKVIRTPDRKVALAPPLLTEEAAVVFGRNGQTGDEISRGRRDDSYDLQLIGRRQLRSHNSWLHNVETMVKGRDRCTAMMHPDDAADRALDDGQRVLVESPVGRIEVPLEVSDEMRPGVVSIPHGWGHDVKDVGWSTAAAHPGANVNLLTDSTLIDRLSGNSALNATWVRVRSAT